MKITKIRLCNLASIEGCAEIDFMQEPLYSTGIFAISGPTGSGKSTILDALCLALYDKTPRFQSTTESIKIPDGSDEVISQNDVRNILRRGSTEGYAEVEFIAVDDMRYRSTWSVRRARNNPRGRLQNQSIQVINLDEDRELQGTKSEILSQLELLIGLSYDQFTRTVLLAQNDFATFLKSKENAKAELLEKLTGTEIYSKISIELYNRQKEEKLTLDSLKNQLDNIKVLSLEEVNKFTEEHAKGSKEQRLVSSAIDKIKKQLDSFLEYKKNDTEIKDSTKQLELIDSSRNEYNQLIEHKRVTIVDFEQKCVAIQSEIEQAIELDGKLSTQQEQYETTERKLADSTNKCKESERQIDVVKSKLKQLKSKLLTIYKDLNIPQNLHEDVEGVLNHLDKQLALTTSSLEGKRLELNKIDIDDLDKRQEELSNKRQLLNHLNADFKDFQNYTLSATQLTEELSILIKQRISEQEQLLKDNTDLSNEEPLLEQVDRLFRQAQLQVSSNVKALRENLKDGEECPVCGSIHHDIEHIKSDSQFSVLSEEQKSKTKKVSQLKSNILALEKSIEQSTTLIMRRETELESLKKRIDLLIQQYNQKQLTKEFIAKSEIALNEVEKELLKERQQLNLLNKEITILNGEKDKIQQKKDLINESYKQYHDEEVALSYQVKNNEQLKEILLQTKNEFDKQDLLYKKLLTERKQLLKGMSVKDAKRSIDERRKKLNEELEALLKQLQKLQNDYSTLFGRIEHLNEVLKTLADKLGDCDEEQLKKELDESNNQLQQLQKQITEIEVLLKQSANNEKLSKQIANKYKKQEVVYGQWRKLSDLFGSATGDRFKVIAQSYTLQILLLHANKHLTYLARRYKLQQVGESLNLQVVDQEMCDEIRTVYSLSGGESFLISLALALGLSSLSSNNLQVESLFIDEGFGSLDAESLRTAMDALEQLQMQGRKIGVISHVQEMGERIPVQIHLLKSNAGKSKISIIG